MSPDLPNVAFKTADGKIVVIVLNEGTSKTAFNIRMDDQYINSSLSAGAVGTYVWKIEN
jgi:glucosylceramidase